MVMSECSRKGVTTVRYRDATVSIVRKYCLNRQRCPLTCAVTISGCSVSSRVQGVGPGPVVCRHGLVVAVPAAPPLER